jgi:hypothetical protein
MVEQQPSKLNTRVRFPSPAPNQIDALRRDFWSVSCVARCYHRGIQQAKYHRAFPIRCERFVFARVTCSANENASIFDGRSARRCNMPRDPLIREKLGTTAAFQPWLSLLF